MCCPAVQNPSGRGLARPLVAGEPYRVQFSKCYVDLRADLDLVPEGAREAPFRLAILDRPCPQLASGGGGRTVADYRRSIKLRRGPSTEQLSRDFDIPIPLVESFRRHVYDSDLAGLLCDQFTEKLFARVEAEQPAQEAWSNQADFTRMGLLADELMRFTPG